MKNLQIYWGPTWCFNEYLNEEREKEMLGLKHALKVEW